jgi:hypothetical protein
MQLAHKYLCYALVLWPFVFYLPTGVTKKRAKSLAIFWQHPGRKYLAPRTKVLIA